VPAKKTNIHYRLKEGLELIHFLKKKSNIKNSSTAVGYSHIPTLKAAEAHIQFTSQILSCMQETTAAQTCGNILIR
jgi:hypothetical protein